MVATALYINLDWGAPALGANANCGSHTLPHFADQNERPPFRIGRSFSRIPALALIKIGGRPRWDSNPGLELRRLLGYPCYPTRARNCPMRGAHIKVCDIGKAERQRGREAEGGTAGRGDGVSRRRPSLAALPPRCLDALPPRCLATLLPCHLAASGMITS